MPSSNDGEALDALFRRARAEPNAEDLRRVKERLHALAAEVEATPRRSRHGVLTSVLAVVGCSLLFASTQTVVTNTTPAPVVRVNTNTNTNTNAAPEPPKPIETVPVQALAAAPEPSSAPKTRARPVRPPPRAEAPAQPKPVDIEKPAEGTVTRSAEVVAESEASFLRRAKVTLAGDPATALRMAEEHPTLYPRGVLIQEREVLAIEALIRLGRAAEARARASSFHSRFPSSAHRGHIDGMMKEAD